MRQRLTAKSYQTSCVAEPEAHTVTTTPAPEPALMPSLPHAGPLLQMIFPFYIKISPHNFLKWFANSPRSYKATGIPASERQVRDTERMKTISVSPIVRVLSPE